MAYSINTLINDPKIKQVLEKQNKPQYYFVKEAKRITKLDYVPTCEDLLHIYIPTHGTHEIEVKVRKDILITGLAIMAHILYKHFQWSQLWFVSTTQLFRQKQLQVSEDIWNKDSPFRWYWWSEVWAPKVDSLLPKYKCSDLFCQHFWIWSNCTRKHQQIIWEQIASWICHAIVQPLLLYNFPQQIGSIWGN